MVFDDFIKTSLRDRRIDVMSKSLLKLLRDLPEWVVYREVAAVLVDADALVAWRRVYESRPQRDALLLEAARVLAAGSPPPAPFDSPHSPMTSASKENEEGWGWSHERFPGSMEPTNRERSDPVHLHDGDPGQDRSASVR